jgi:hypothetical protein
VNYGADRVAIILITANARASAPEAATRLGAGKSLADAYRTVISQKTNVEAFFNSRPAYEDPIIEEEDIVYPMPRVFDTRGIRGIRR